MSSLAVARSLSSRSGESRVRASVLLAAEDQVVISTPGRFEDTASIACVGEGDRTAAEFTDSGGVGGAGRALWSLVCRVRCRERGSVTNGVGVRSQS